MYVADGRGTSTKRARTIAPSPSAVPVPSAVPAPVAASVLSPLAAPCPPPRPVPVPVSVPVTVEGAGVRTRSSLSETSLVLQQVQATAAMMLELHSVSAKRSAHQANISLLHAAATLSSGDLAVVVSDINGYGVVALRDYDIGDVLTEFGGLLTTLHDMRQLPAARGTHVRMVHDASGAARDGSLLATWFQQMLPDQRAAELRLPMHLRTRLSIDVARINLPGASQLQGTRSLALILRIASARACCIVRADHGRACDWVR